MSSIRAIGPPCETRQVRNNRITRPGRVKLLPPTAASAGQARTLRTTSAASRVRAARARRGPPPPHSAQMHPTTVAARMPQPLSFTQAWPAHRAGDPGWTDNHSSQRPSWTAGAGRPGFLHHREHDPARNALCRIGALPARAWRRLSVAQNGRSGVAVGPLRSCRHWPGRSCGCVRRGRGDSGCLPRRP